MTSKEFLLEARQFVRNLRDLRYREVLMTFAILIVVTGFIFLFPGRENVTLELKSNVSRPVLALFVIVAIVAGAVKGMMGFGYALITTPVFVSIIDPTLAVVVLAIPPWMLNMFQIGETDTGFTFIREEWPLLCLAAAGSIIGVLFLERFQTTPLITFLIGTIIFTYVVFQLIKNSIVVQKAHHPIGLGVVGFFQGLLLATANLGPLLPAYFHTFERDIERYIGGLSMVLLVIFTVRILQMTFFSSLMTTYRLWLGSVIAVITLIGLFIGTYLRHIEVDEEKFNWLVMALLLAIALHIFWQTIPTLVS